MIFFEFIQWLMIILAIYLIYDQLIFITKLLEQLTLQRRFPHSQSYSHSSSPN